MDAFSDPTTETLVVMSSAQVGKSEVILNALGQIIDQQPGPVLVLQPTLDMSRTFSTDRIAPMVRDCTRIRDRVSDPKSKSGEATILHRNFEGGHYTLIGANAPSGLAGRPIKYLFADEVDRYPQSAGAEGDPIKLAMKRTTTYHNRKLVVTSTPTVKGVSRIEEWFEQGNQSYYYVPCTQCGEYQKLEWGNVKFEREDKKLIPGSVYYECEKCQAHLTEADKLKMVARGKWVATFPERTRVKSFHISELYSPWSTWENVVLNFLESKDNVENLRVFINTCLGQSWDSDEVTQIDEATLSSKVEDYQQLPNNVLLLTAGVDTQDTWLEAVVYGYAAGEESWVVDRKQIVGSPASGETWDQLLQYLQKVYRREDGVTLRVACTAIDSGGNFTQQVYDFCKRNELHRIFAIKGFAGQGHPIISKFSIRGRAKVKLYNVGVDTAKEEIYSRLQKEDFGPGYIHFSREVCDTEFFRQLTAEKQTRRYVRGFPKIMWQKIRARNEVLDCTVYALAAMRILNPDFDALKVNLDAQVPHQEVQENQQKPQAKPVPRSIYKPMRAGWITGY